MREKLLSFLGLMRRAGALKLGETNTGEAVRGGKAKLLLLSADASDNALRRAEGFARGRSVLTVPQPFTKAELSDALGSGEYAMMAVTDIGFANALMQQLSQLEPERYAGLAEETARRHEKAERRKRESRAHERNKRTGKGGRTNDR